MIRIAKAEDAAAVAALSTELGYPATPAQMTARLADVLARADAAVFVFEQTGAVVGWIHVVGCHRLEDEPFAEIGGLVVGGPHRGAGAGARLVAAAESWAVAHGYGRMFVRSNVIRERAHTFYRRAGFVQFKQQAVFSKPLPGEGARS